MKPSFKLPCWLFGTPVLAALRDCGLSAKRIADNSRIRPEAVERLLA